jgi:methionine-rich copper-binding protein CopC
LAASRVVIAALVGLLPASAALAHALLVQSEPAVGANIPPGKVVMSFRYNSRIDRGRSLLTITRPDHTQSVLKINAEGPPDVLETSTDLTALGSYSVRWQVLATDGHITRGDVPFIVTNR